MSRWPKITLKSRWGRLALVPPSPEDDAEVAALRNDPVTLKYVLSPLTNMTAEEWRVKREANDQDDSIWNFHIHLTSPPPDKSRFAGQCVIWQIDLPNRAGEIGILISSHLHRTGVATEALHAILSNAFEHPDLKLHRVQFITAANNVQMRGWCKSFGIEVEHRLREVWDDGKGGWMDGVGYSILEDEWPGLKKRLENWLDARIPSTLQTDI